MPKLGMYVEDISLVQWLVAEGARVRAGEVLFELESDKSTSEVEAEIDGLVHLLVDAGSSVPIGTVVAVIASSPDEYRDLLSDRAIETGPPAIHGVSSPTIDASPSSSFSSLTVLKQIALTGTRGVIARRMQQSLQTAAQLTSILEVDASPLVELRLRLTAEGQAAGFTAMFVKVLSEVLPHHPILNARVVENQIEVLEEVNIAVAMDTEAGVIAPVLQAPREMSLPDIETRIRDLAARTRQGLALAEELEGATFTLSNGGAWPVDVTTPVLVPPQVGLLWIGRVRERPFCIDGQLAVRPTVHLCLTYDHRAVDGGPAAAFLGALEQAIHNLNAKPDRGHE